MTQPARGFDIGEYRARLARAQTAMRGAGLAALLLTTEPEIRYFTGFLTRFWESPTRPWFLVVPCDGNPVAVIPEIGAHLMGQCWIRDIRTWAAPDYDDDGIGLLRDTLSELVPGDGDIGLPDGIESHMRMPLADFRRLETLLGKRRLTGDQAIMRHLRMIKSEAEIAKIARACDIADRAFARVPLIARPGVPLSHVFRDFQVLCLEQGADWVPYLAGACARGGYGDVISPATDAPLAEGDVLMLDTGLVWDGYFCDFDRNFAVTGIGPQADAAHERLLEAVQAGADAARPGARACDLFHAMERILNPDGAVPAKGRLGHGLGMQLTEWPSLIPADQTVLEPGMVLTLEPVAAPAAGRILVHEENIVIRDNGPVFLSDFRRGPMPGLS